VWLTRGDLVEAIRASYALPGIFEPVQTGGRWLFDGALVNPVPITVCRALGADMVIAVNLNADTLGRGTVIQDHMRMERAEAEEAPPLDALGMMARSRPRGAAGAPGLATVMVDAFNITQDRITRSRLAGDPPDAMIGVKMGRIGLFEFHRAEEAIAMGREAVRRIADDLRELTGARALA
jgi:NTE family protein